MAYDINKHFVEWIKQEFLELMKANGFLITVKDESSSQKYFFNYELEDVNKTVSHILEDVDLPKRLYVGFHQTHKGQLIMSYTPVDKDFHLK